VVGGSAFGEILNVVLGGTVHEPGTVDVAEEDSIFCLIVSTEGHFVFVDADVLD